jgi:hypothetical protein
MAIKTVTSQNLVDDAVSKTAAATLNSAEAVTAEVQKNAEKAASPVVATGSETVSTAPEPVVDPADVGKTKGVQERINELTRLRKEAEEFAEDEYNGRLRAERRVGELEEQLAKGRPAEAVPAPVVEEELKRPSPKDFTDQESYDKAMADYDVKRDERTAAKVRREESMQREMDRVNEELRIRTVRAQASIPDFNEVIGAADRTQVVVPLHIKAAIIESEYGPELAYHLAKNPEEQKRVFALTPARALLELGKIETKYMAAETTKAKAPTTVETTRAPAPVATVTTGEGVVQTDLANAPTFADYKRQRLAEKRRARG